MGKVQAPQFGNGTARQQSLEEWRDAVIPDILQRPKRVTKNNRPHHKKSGHEHAPTENAYKVVANEQFDGRQVHLNPQGLKGYFTRDENLFVPCGVRQQLRAAGSFKS